MSSTSNNRYNDMEYAILQYFRTVYFNNRTPMRPAFRAGKLIMLHKYIKRTVR